MLGDSLLLIGQAQLGRIDRIDENRLALGERFYLGQARGRNGAKGRAHGGRGNLEFGELGRSMEKSGVLSTHRVADAPDILSGLSGHGDDCDPAGELEEP